jgi:hypothetical protein
VDAKEYLMMLGKRRWELMTPAQQEAHIRKMVAGQRRARKHRQAKVRGAK